MGLSSEAESGVVRCAMSILLEERGRGEAGRGSEREMAGVTGVEREANGREREAPNRDENEISLLLISSPLGSSSIST